MAFPETLEVAMSDQEATVKATIGYLYKIRNDLGFYEAKVASLVQPTWYRDSTPYLLGNEVSEGGKESIQGAWIQFGDPAETITALWQPRIGDRVIVYTFGSYGFTNGRVYRLPTSDDNTAKLSEEMKVNGPLRTLSGGML